MKTIFRFFAFTTFIILQSCGQQEQKVSTPIDKKIPSLEDNIITSNSVDKAYVDMDIEDLKRSYHNYQFLDTPAYYFGLDGEEKDLVIAKNNIPLMFVWTGTDKKVRGLFAVSNKFHTENGLRPRMTIAEIKKIYPDCEMAQDNMTGNMEYIYIPDKKVSLCFMTNQNTIGIYNDSDAITPMTKTFKSDTFRVQFIQTSN